MNILVLSCGTGGGHNSAGYAISEEMQSRGHCVDFRDVYEIVGKHKSELLNGAYIGMARKTPRLFGLIYSLGESCDRLSTDSPVYRINSREADKLYEHLSKNEYDAVVISHMFAAHMLKGIKSNGGSVPKSVFLATDYTCSPFTGESDCDLYVIPHPSLEEEFISQGIPSSRIRAIGIPVSRAFSEKCNKEEERKRLGLEPDAFYYLIAGGSMGAGAVEESLETVCDAVEPKRKTGVIVICGSNEKLYNRLVKEYADKPFARIVGRTDKMAGYMKAADVFISKPGGLSSTEAATVGIPLIHISPIPGCETKNAEFFKTNGMSLYAERPKRDLNAAVRIITERKAADILVANQRKYINPNAASDICDYIEREL